MDDSETELLNMQSKLQVAVSGFKAHRDEKQQGLPLGRVAFGSLKYASWSLSAILPMPGTKGCPVDEMAVGTGDVHY